MVVGHGVDAVGPVHGVAHGVVVVRIGELHPVVVRDVALLGRLGQGLVRGADAVLEVLPGLGRGQVAVAIDLGEGVQLLLQGGAVLVGRGTVLLAGRGRRDLVAHVDGQRDPLVPVVAHLGDLLVDQQTGTEQGEGDGHRGDDGDGHRQVATQADPRLGENELCSHDLLKVHPSGLRRAGGLAVADRRPATSARGQYAWP